MTGRKLIGVAALMVAVMTGVAFLNLWIFLETPSRAVRQEMTIEPGTSMAVVLGELHRRRLISNTVLFKAWIYLTGSSAEIRAGSYLFEDSITPRRLLTALRQGDFPRFRVTIPEGWTVRQIASLLEEREFVHAEVFGELASKLEGYLHPDTYEFYKSNTEEEILRRMVLRFQKVVDPVFQGAVPPLGMSLYEVLTLASIVEKETGRDEERGLVASVLLNRLQRGMALASDPTVIYGIADFDGNLTRRHLETPGPYNTYRNAGLPPTPICNPGLASIQAVLHPPETDYLFFVSRGDGSHQFSRTQAEHSRAVWKYQKRGG